GVLTPDENLIDSSTFDVKSISPGITFAEGGIARNIRFINCYSNGVVVNGTVNRHYEDGLVICMATKKSKYIARKLGKTACVKINNINKLINCVNEHTGVIGVHGVCTYTATHERNHFLKSTYDQWQREYRMFWKGVGNIEVELPPGLGKVEFILP
ncbi:TPA: hypothetical protein M6A56_004628, partial [Klebsiella pneumoniae]|nr:hypothetical protein [Klebsiella pneumoniae]